MAKICIVGSGYVGLCTGLVFAERGHQVTFVDVDAAKLAAVERGEAPFFEPGVSELLKSLHGKFATTTKLADAVAASEFTFLCVGTPPRPDGSIDLRFIEQAARDVGAALPRAARGHIIVTKSTVVPGTAERVVTPNVAKASGLRAGVDFHVASNPEFLKEGSALKDARAPERIVVGASDAAAGQRILALYDGFPGERLVVAPTTAELTKYAANAFLAMKISFANEMANLCERVGVEWYDVVAGIGPDARIGPLFLRAGVGFGGSCFPKDVAAIATFAKNEGVPSKLLEAVLEHNEEQPLVAVRMLEEELGSLSGKRIALLGLAFKPSTDDVRETRALPLWNALHERGAEVVCYDPEGAKNFAKMEPRAKLASTLEEALRGADAALVQTEWPEFRALDPAKLRTWMRAPVVVDGRRAFDAAKLRAAGVKYRAIGLGKPTSS